MDTIQKIPQGMEISLRQKGALKAEPQGRGAAWAACLYQDGLRLDSGVVKVAVPSRMRAIPARMSGPLAASGPAGAS